MLTDDRKKSETLTDLTEMENDVDRLEGWASTREMTSSL